MKRERLARTLVFVLVLALGASALAWRLWGHPGIVEIHAAMPGKGGWLTDTIEARVGEPLVLSLVSDDVMHGFAIGQSDFEPVDVLPGKPTMVTLTFDQPGTYTFYCTRWCGADHWRMRGTITVTGDWPVSTDPPQPPLYLQLGINLDASHELHDFNLKRPPSSENGAALGATLPAEFLTLEYYRSHSLYQTWHDLRAQPSAAELTDQQVWDLVARVWSENTSPEKLAEGEKLYQRDCAACHGASGVGDGIFGAKAESRANEPHQTSLNAVSIVEPVDFTGSAQMLGASPALLQGKIIRGGMGTGMPSWGLIYTEEQTWNLVDYLWTFQFDYEN